MSFSKKGPKRKKVTKTFAPTGAINPIEHTRTNTEDLAVAGLKRDSKRKVRPEHSPGGAGTFSPANNEKFE